MRNRVLLVLVAVLALGLATPPGALAAHHEEGETEASPEAGDSAPAVPALAWNAEKMTELTAKLSKEIRETRNAFRQSPNYENDRLPNQRTAAQMYETLKTLDQSCASLAKRVEKGEDAEQTRGLARSIGQLLNDVDEYSRKLPTQDWTAQKARLAMQTINEIAPYYGRGPLYDVEDMTKLDRGPNPNRRPDEGGTKDEKEKKDKKEKKEKKEKKAKDQDAE